MFWKRQAHHEISPTPPNSLTGWMRYAYVANALLAATMWLCFVSHGFTASGILDKFYEIQADSLSRGQLSIVPGPSSTFYHDALIYWGKYYFYWGLSPSLCFLLLSKLAGRILANYLIVWVLFFILFYFFQKILLGLIGHINNDETEHSKYLHIGGMLLAWLLIFFLPFPVDSRWFFGRFTIYEQQIIFGIAFAMPGLYYMYTGIHEKSAIKITASVFFFSMGALTRVTWFPLALLLLPVSIFLIWKWRIKKFEGASFCSALLLLLPSLIILVVIMALNYFRFASPFDFGVKYQIPSYYYYLRNLKMFFSLATRMWNAAFNIMSYYAPWGFLEYSGLLKNSFSLVEGYTPSFFSFNPQFLPMLFILPFGLYRSFKLRKPLMLPITLLTSTAVYLNIIIGFFGTMVIMRYFIEFYYFIVLSFIAALFVLVRPKYAIPLFALLFIFYIPGTLNSFYSIRPRLRVVDSKPDNQVRINHADNENIAWPRGALSSLNKHEAPFYSMIGIENHDNSAFLGKDVFAVYMIPEENPAALNTFLKIKRIRSLQTAGTVMLYFENRFIGPARISPERAIDISIKVPFQVSSSVPYQILAVFLPDGSVCLSGRSPGNPVLAFVEIRLEAGLPHQASTPH